MNQDQDEWALNRLSIDIQQREIRTIKIGGPDLDGVFRGKRIPAEQFLTEVQRGFTQSAALFGLDIGEESIDVVELAGRQSGYPDLQMLPDPVTFRIVPWEESTAVVIADFALANGQPVEASPRNVLKRVIERFGKVGLTPIVGTALEFRLFRETHRSAREKGWNDLDPLSASQSAYGVSRATGDEFIVGRIAQMLNEHAMAVEGYQHENGQGLYGINVRFADALRCADNTLLYKTAVKEISEQAGLLASFMAKPFDGQVGQSCHLHISLWDQDVRRNLFPGEGGGISDLMRYFLGGLVATVRELMPLYAPTVNSYKRFYGESLAPISISWGQQNRTTAIRAISPPKQPASTRLELRLPGSDCNPYLAIAAALAGGLNGVVNKIEPPAPVNGNAHALPISQVARLPRTLDEATEAFSRSSLAREYLGESFARDFLASRRWEVEKYNRSVSDWERRRYLESV